MHQLPAGMSQALARNEGEMDEREREDVRMGGEEDSAPVRSFNRSTVPALPYLFCVSCGHELPLEDRTVQCRCGRSMAQPDEDGHSYRGPAVPMTDAQAEDGSPVPVRATDSARIHRARSEPLI